MRNRFVVVVAVVCGVVISSSSSSSSTTTTMTVVVTVHIQQKVIFGQIIIFQFEQAMQLVAYQGR